MSTTKIPGMCARHAIVTPTCRANRTNAGAFLEAMDRLGAEYHACVNAEHGKANADANYHLVLTVERGSVCSNCGDSSGWLAWYPQSRLVWVACADCNDDGTKPKPILCQLCGQTSAFCLCTKHVGVGQPERDEDYAPQQIDLIHKNQSRKDI